MRTLDARTEELRSAHDVLAEVYAGRLAGALDRMPVERAVLGLFAELIRGARLCSSWCSPRSQGRPTRTP